MIAWNFVSLLLQTIESFPIYHPVTHEGTIFAEHSWQQTSSDDHRPQWANVCRIFFSHFQPLSLKVRVVIRRTNNEWTLGTFDVVRWPQEILTLAHQNEAIKQQQQPIFYQMDERIFVANPVTGSFRCGKESIAHGSALNPVRWPMKSQK